MTAELLAGEKTYPLRPLANRRLPQWRVAGDCTELTGDRRPGGVLPLNYVLLRHNQTPVAFRVPLAVAASAVPDLGAKLAGGGAPALLPLVRTEVEGLSAPGSDFVILWPDLAQLAVLDEPDRKRVVLQGDRFPVVLPSGERLSHCHAYVDETGLADMEPATTITCYDDVLPLHEVPGGALRVRRSEDDFDRDGEPTVRVAREVAERLGAKHVLVSAHGADPGIQALARIVVNTRLESPAELEVDQLIRNSIGVEIGEDVVVTPVKARRHRLSRLIVGKPNYVVCRVQAADLATVEQEVCLLDELTLGLLGVPAGDQVIVDGVAEPGGRVKQVRMKALKTSEAVQQRRESLHGGNLSCRFPSARDALAVYPDLPWIFLDSATRTALGLADRKLSTVRLRPSRGYQLRKELREMMLLIGVAFIGVVSIVKSDTTQWVMLGALVLFAGGVVTMRMRGRLKHELRIPRRQRAK
ncbi:hypothetical protein SAMN05421504_11173 [Amycolatopsis xylanica]|uniref:Uncharacterized protein n=1 Tax=Amycolatopsis xylanica TaxID=589385 RepID=A0A1H3RGG1_9PSEU|nr:hypothetical protein [Amycolatopsis xylanica]SDZ24746.1 hypothetical protein SAMN05421504_11173 [Amycolatopsis xylanica]